MSFYQYGFLCGYRGDDRANFGEAYGLAQFDYDRGYEAGKQELQLDIERDNQLNKKEPT